MTTEATTEWKVNDKALIETWGPKGPTGQWHLMTIAWINHVGPYYHLHGQHCYDLTIVRSARELRRPTPTEPATCHKVRRMVGIHVRVEPPSIVAEGSENMLFTWAEDFCDLLRYVRYGQNNITTVQRDEQDQCSACGKEWTPYSWHGSRVECLHCHVPVGLKEPTP